MRSRIPRQMRWNGHKRMEELLDDPVAESLYGLFLKVKDGPRHITIKPELLLNEVYFISNKIYQDKEPCDKIEVYEHEIESDMGWHYAKDLVMPMIYALINCQKKRPQYVDKFLGVIKEKYIKSSYWPVFSSMPNPHHASIRKDRHHSKVIDMTLNQIQKNLNVFQDLGQKNIYFTLNIQNDINGNIDHLHVAHADVAVGVAEKGSNVYHHKTDSHE